MSDFTFFFTLLLISAVFGTTMGAYFCTMQYRIREDLPLVTSDCICPACGHRLLLFHQIPIISFFLLKGKCRFCHNVINNCQRNETVRFHIVQSDSAVSYAAVTIDICIIQTHITR